MERRSFLASLAALFATRRLPRAADGLYDAELSLASNEMLLDAAMRDPEAINRMSTRFTSVRFDWDERERRYKARIPPDVWGDEREVAFTITTTP